MALIQQEIINQLEKAETVWVVSHLRPDGDAIGSSLGLAHVLKQLGKTVVLINGDPVPEMLTFLPGVDTVVTPDVASRQEARPDVAVVVDCSSEDRVSPLFWQMLPEGVPLINIDHHISNTFFAGVNWVDAESPSTGQILYRLVKEAGWPLSKDLADCLYVATSTDTGSFRYPSTSAETFRMAAELVDVGVNVGLIGQQLYESYPLRRLELLRDLIPTLRLDCEGRCSSLTLSKELYERLNLGTGDTEGIIELIRAVKPVIVAVVFEEQPDGTVRVSSRSKMVEVSVGEICQRFGGGGHRLAAGARLEGPLDEAVERFLAVVNEFLGDHHSCA